MKKLLILLLAFAAVAVTACDKDTTEPGFTVSPLTIQAVAEAGDYPVNVDSKEAWTVNNDTKSDWIKLDKANGTGNGTFNISVTDYTFGGERTATVTVQETASGKSATVTILQSGPEAHLELDKNSVVSDTDGDSYIIRITTNTKWTISIGGDASSWITLSKTEGEGDGAFSITVKKIETSTPREGVVTVSGGGLSAEINVSQEGLPPGVKWAYSNIYIDNSGNLTFATAPDAVKEHYQGIYFLWGSLIGISPAGADDSNFALTDIVFTPSEFTGSIPSWTGIPYNTGTEVTSGYDAAAGIGDICAYISSKGWVDGEWRMPTQYDYWGLAGGGYEISPGAGMIEGNSKGTTQIAQGWFMSTGDNRRMLPANGYRFYEPNDSYPDGQISGVGASGNYWTSTPATDDIADYTLKAAYLPFNEITIYPQTFYYRQNGFAVRCVTEI
jgi:hypothetical protein